MTSFFAVGLGCDSRTPLETLRAALEQALARAGIAPGHIVAAASITLKAKEPGLLALVGVTHTDGVAQAARIARKIAELRLLEGDDASGPERSVTDLGAPVLVVSQFTLYADVRKGRRPSWNGAAPGPVAQPLVDAVVADLRARGLEVATGRFGARMRIDMEADGPVTVLVEAD